MNILEVFLVFFKISFISFGGVSGVLPELQNMIVNEHHWMTSKTFYEAYVIGQFVPGPNMAMSGVIGYLVAGIGGWFAGLAGIYLGPLIIMKIASHYYEKHREVQALKRIELALRPLVIGLISASAIRIFITQTQGAILWALLVSVIIGYFYWKKKLSAISSILVAGAIWWFVGKSGIQLPF